MGWTYSAVMIDEATSQAVLIARFSEHKAAALAAAELVNAGFHESDLRVVFAEEQRPASDANPSSLRAALQQAVEGLHLHQTRNAGTSKRPKLLTVDTGATLTLLIHDQIDGARAILTQHGAEFA